MANIKLFCLPISAVCIVLLLLFSVSGFAEETNKQSYRVEDLSFDELNKIELTANQARRYYWMGDYPKALKIFEDLAQKKHPSTPLYYNEIAFCYISANDFANAEKKLNDVDQFFGLYNTAKREEKALSSFGKESEKIYMGDPYERTANYLLLALIYMDRRDYENAIASCKNGLLADSDATENKYESDFTLLHLLEAKLYEMVGKFDSATKCFDLARESYCNSHPLVRDLISERQDLLALQRLSEAEREELKVKDAKDEINQKLAHRV